jgi:hypothetical protein
MKRLLRILAAALLALSLLISISALYAWHRSLSYWDFVSLNAGRTHIMLNTYPDAMLLTCGHRQAGPPGEWTLGHYAQRHTSANVVNHQYRWGLRWFGIQRYQWTEARLVPAGLTYRGFGFAASFWSIALITFFPPALFFSLRLRRFLKRRSRRRLGHCPNCGYDLRASPSKCPECGATTNSIQNEKSPLPAPR